jgi:putative DNA primase/helicase
MNVLHPDHLEDLRRSGLSDETIRAAGIYTVTPGDIGKKLGGNNYGILTMLAFPYPGCGGFERFKVFREEKADPKAPKYLQKTGTPNHLYLLPGINLAGESPLIITEGEKKALALWQAAFQVVGLSGIWAWVEKAEGGYRQPKESRPIPDFDLVNWHRPVSVVFDSDGHDNPLVRLAAFRLARELSRRGAAVSILFIPPSPTGEKQEADDFLVAHGPEKLWEMIL